MDISKKALDLYKPPFKFEHGYVFDSNNEMVGDDSCGRDEDVENNDGSLALRVRGWGRIQKMDNPEKLQDSVGEHITKALNQYWASNA